MPSKKGYKCPTCGKGRMVIEIMAVYKTKLGGVKIVIKDAKIRRCSSPSCNEICVSASEIKRWRAEGKPAV